MVIDAMRAIATYKRCMDTATMRKRGSVETISRGVCVTNIRTLRSGVPGNGHAPFWSSGRRGALPIDCNNGDIGQVAQVDPEEGQVEIDFEGRLVTYDVGELDEVALAYAATVHKSQGSEYPVVVIPLATQHYPMLARNLLYTGVTRGKQLVVVIGQPRALAIAVRNVRAT